MNQMKLRVLFTFFPYGGNGGISSEIPAIRNWTVSTILKASKDPRIEDILHKDFSDTPITMTRNAAVQHARSVGADVLVMCDSDQHPDVELGSDPTAKPFWDTSFEFLYDHYHRGPVVVGAPYCGPPPLENVYAFTWANMETGSPNDDLELKAYTREHAEILAGIQECAALPTGLIMYDMRIFDVVEPPYFYYEYSDKFEQQKASTEDVTATRDFSLFGKLKLDYAPVFCNWDAWAGHMKPKLVRKPRTIKLDQVDKKYQGAVLRNHSSNERLIVLGDVAPKKEPIFILHPDQLGGSKNGDSKRTADVGDRA